MKNVSIKELAQLEKENVLQFKDEMFQNNPYMQTYLKILSGFLLRNFTNPDYAVQYLQEAISGNKNIHPEEHHEIEQNLEELMKYT